MASEIKNNCDRVSLRVNLKKRNDNPSKVTFKANLNLNSEGSLKKQDEDQLTFKIEKLGQSSLQETPVGVYNAYSSRFATKVEANSEQNLKIQNAYAKLKAQLAPNAKTFTVNIAKGTYSSDRSVEQFLDPKDKDYSDLVCAVYPIWGGKLRRLGGGGVDHKPSHEPQALSRSNEVLQSLSTTPSDSAKLAMRLFSSSQNDNENAQEAALKKLVALETLVNSQTTLIKNKLTELEDNQSPSDSEKKNIEELNYIKKKLEMDRLAMYLAVAFYPTDPTPDNVEVAAHRLKESLKAQLVDNRSKIVESKKRGWRSYLPHFLLSFFKLDPESHVSSDTKAFCKAVADLMYAPHHVMPKAECNEESIVRFILRGDKSDLSGVEILFKSITDATIKQECLAQLKNVREVQIPKIFKDPLTFAEGTNELEAKIDQLFLEPNHEQS